MNEPWKSFLNDLDAQLTGPTEIHCFGGFVVAEQYGLIRATADIDVIESHGTTPAALVALAGKGSDLHQKHKVYVDIVTVADVPYEYESRLIPVFENEFKNLRLKAFDRHDLVLAKLGRNIDRDRQDVEALTNGPGLDVELLKKRFDEEMEPYIGNPKRERLTLDLWIEIIKEIQETKRS